MLEFLNRLVDLLGTNPSLTPWILLIIVFVLCAIAAGRAGKMALGNVENLMKQGASLHERQEKELEKKDRIIEARDKYIEELVDDRNTTIDFVTNLRRDQAELMDRIFELERVNRGLIQDYHDALRLLEMEKDRVKELINGSQSK